MQLNLSLKSVISLNWKLGQMEVGFNMGTGKPMVPDKQVPWVWVWYPIWHTWAKPCTHGTVSQVWAGILRAESGPPTTYTLMPPNEQSLRSKISHQQLASSANDSPPCLCFLNGSLRLSDANTTLIALAIPG